MVLQCPHYIFRNEFSFPIIGRMDSIKAIFLDFDWTLFDHKTRSFNEAGVQALNEAHEKGILLIIDSARTYHSLRGLGTFGKIPFDGFVVSNGGAAFTKEGILYADYMEDDARDDILRYLDGRGIGYNLICLEDTFIKERDQKVIKDFYSVWYEPYPLPIVEWKGERALAIQALMKEEEDPGLVALCRKHGIRFERFADNAVELTATEFLKSKGVQTMYNHLRLKPEEAMAFGDDLNDIPMFRMVKYGICLGNGKEEAKKAAYYVTDAIEKDGLAKALRHFGIVS